MNTLPILLVPLVVIMLSQAFIVAELLRMRGRHAGSAADESAARLRFSSALPSYGGVRASAAGYAIYVYRGGRWHLESDLSAPGHEPSPPVMAGSYEGQAIKKESSPAR